MKTINIGERQGSLPFQSAYSTLDYLTNKFNLSKELKMNQEVGTIYIATNLQNGKQYVGQTVKPFHIRQKAHSYSLQYFGRAIKKYNKDNFKWVSYSCPEGDLDWHERFLIKELNTLAPNGYNLESGGNKNKHLHETTRQKVSRNHADVSGKNNPLFGKHHTHESKDKMRKAKEGYIPWSKGIKFDEEHIKNISLSQVGKHQGIKNHMYGKKGKENPNFGRKNTEETKNLMSDIRKKYLQEHPEVIEKMRERKKEYWRSLRESKNAG